MHERKVWWAALAGALFLISGPLRGAELSVEGGPMETGFNSGTFAYIHATVRGVTGPPKRYVVFAEIQYYGTTSNTSLEMDRLPETKPGVEEFQVAWPIPPQAPTGLYTLTLHVDDRIEHLPGITKKVRGFVVYKKFVRISRVTLDKTQYNVGDPIQCEVGLENLSDTDVKGLRVEFANAVYPWISLSSQGSRDSPDLAVKVLRDNLNIPSGTAVTVPMVTAATATLLRGKQQEAEGAAIPPGSANSGFPEVDTYAVALWNADHTILYDLQFTLPVMVRTLDHDLPKPYSRNYTHPYNSTIDFARYREFYAPDQISAALRVDSARTLYRPGDTVNFAATLKNTEDEPLDEGVFSALITDMAGEEVYSGWPVKGLNTASGATQKVAGEAWVISPNQTPGTYHVRLVLARGHGKLQVASTTTEIAVNALPASLLVVCAHEGDEQAYAGLIRACLESNIPVEVLILTSGDVSGCNRYFDRSCGPNEAREFGYVRMEESADGLAHLGLPRDKLILMGLPEDGLVAIWADHKDPSNPFLSIFLACDHVPYANAYQPNLPYARDAVVEALRQIISDFHPAMIALTHPDDRNGDRRAASWFAIKACQELLKVKGLDPQTVLLTDQASGTGVVKPAPYKYEDFVVHLSGEAAALKQEMAWIYQSQNGNQSEAARKSLAELPREEKYLRIMDWQEHEGWNDLGRN
jgi:LmbE family N-acetylglucosaminyl deacetylase